METTPDTGRDLAILERIEHDPDINQSTLATQLGVAVGTINWHLKRLISKGYVKIKPAERRKLRYIITPEGIALRARLTVDYIDQQFKLYRNTRQRVAEQITRLQQAGYKQVQLVGDGDVADICRLSCLEYGIEIVNDKGAPVMEVHGLKVLVHMNGEE